MVSVIVPAKDVQAGQEMDALIEADQLKLIQVHVPSGYPPRRSGDGRIADPI